MSSSFVWLIAALTFLTGLMLGMRKWRGEQSTPDHHGMEIPPVWPFDLRRVAGSEERRIWIWLRQIFPDHQVLVKLPVTRFIIPQRPNKGREWFRVLSTVYCTFTVCTNEGRVLGCLDIMTGPNSLSRINRQIKESLLAQCGISYWAVPLDRMPNSDTLRAEFLDDDYDTRQLDMDPPASVFQPLDDVRLRLHQTLDRNRRELRFQNSAQVEFDTRPTSLDTNGLFNATVPSDLGSLPRSDPGRPSGFLTSRQRRRAGLDLVG